MSDRDVPIRPAATVICLRDGEDGVEVLLVRRNSKLVFHGGAWVFPGGRVDAVDVVRDGMHLSEEHPARTAAVRESYEEASLRLRPESLVPLSHWTTPSGRPRRFSTWFFIAHSPPEEVRVDEGEIDSHWWVTPAQALAKRAAGSIELPPPTFVSLTWLHSMESVQTALAFAREQPFERFIPRLVLQADGIVSLYGGDAGYETGEIDRAGERHRLWMLRDGWRYERTGDGQRDDG